MRILFDALATSGGSESVVMGNVVRAWAHQFNDDDLHVLRTVRSGLGALPAQVSVTESDPQGNLSALAGRIWQAKRLAKKVGADAVISAVPASNLNRSDATRAIIMHDLRHVELPQQFSRGERGLRWLTWGASVRLADTIFCVSARTVDDLRERYPGAAAKSVLTPNGADHVDDWGQPAPTAAPTALAFAHFTNKQPQAVIDAWARFVAAHPDWRLVICGAGEPVRTALSEMVRAAGMQDSIEVRGRLDDSDFRSLFLSSSMVIFPSDFEGFGLPVAEAMRLGIPTVISADAALQELTAGLSHTATSQHPEALASAMTAAAAQPDAQTRQGVDRMNDYTWANTARSMRAALPKSR